MIRILQISDSHILGQKPSIFLDIYSLENFKAVIAEVKKDINEIRPKLLVFTGDLSHDQSELSYQYIAEEITNLACPIAVIPGNHDDPAVMAKVLNHQQKEFIFNNWHIMLLNSFYAGHESGFLNNAELAFLQHGLQKYPHKHTLIFLHHHVVPTGSEWLDPMGVENHKAILAILHKHKNVKIVASGHGHQDVMAKYNNIEFFISPATSLQFKKNSKILRLDTLRPGFRWFNLYADGKYETGVNRVRHTDLRICLKS
jgi:Icc protein